MNKDSDADTKAPRISCRFVIGGRDLDPDEVTRVTGIEPTEIWRQKREETLRLAPLLPAITWSVGFEKRLFYSTSDALEELMLTL